ncbi:MAG: hypothetical protein LBT31_06360 [Synergistaceae bacterium]|nr:hypothetical protein [Synergistaceae bacterium]
MREEERPAFIDIPEEELRSKPRVFTRTIDGETVVVKQRVKPDMIFVHVFQNMLTRLLKDPLMLRTDATPGEKPSEAQKLRLLAENGIRVPKVLHETENYFIMEYGGENLGEILRDTPDIERQNEYIRRALSEMKTMHGKNFVHGGAQIRNFTFLDDEVYIIDFEEVIPEEYIQSFKIRDLIIFLMSLEKAGAPRGLEWVCRAYDEMSWREVLAELVRAILRYRFLKFLKWRIFSRIRMSDVRASLALIEKAEMARLDG